MAEGRVKMVESLIAMPSTQVFLSTVMNRDEPLVLRRAVSDWECASWNPEFLARELGDLETQFKFALRESNGKNVQLMETECEFATGTLSNFCSWLRGEREQAQQLARFDRDGYWCYAAYKYMAEVFKDLPHLRCAVDWSKFGFPGRTGDDSTIWIGSEGASTPCHMDSYSCNLVAQICGQKKWALFSPRDSEKLHPTRVPYEESSVFSQVNVVNPDLDLFPNFKDAVHYQAVLQPGDVLFVPKHWWHYVESLDTSISINTWIELESDHVDRVHEAVTRTLVSALKRAEGSHESVWVNPTEELGTHEENMAFLWQSLNSLHYQMETGTTGKCTQEKTPKTGRITTNDFVNCLSSPEVLKLITGQLMRKLGGKTGTPRELGMASTAHKICSCATIVGSISHLVPDSCSSTDQQVCECRTKVTARDSKTEFQRHESERNQDVPVDTHAERKKPRLDFEEGRIP